MYVNDTNINKNHSSLQMLHAIYFTDAWDRGMGWTIRYSCVSERSHDPMGPWDGMDSRTHASVEGQVDIPWKVPWGCGIGWTIPCNPMGPWGRDGQFTYGISGQPLDVEGVAKGC